MLVRRINRLLGIAADNRRMTRAPASLPVTVRLTEALRFLIVGTCAAALILAGEALPF